MIFTFKIFIKGARYNFFYFQPMPCTRDTFVGRIKKIKTESCDNKLSMPHASLVLLVNKIMAEQEKKHKLQKEQYEIKVRYLQIK